MQRIGLVPLLKQRVEGDFADSRDLRCPVTGPRQSAQVVHIQIRRDVSTTAPGRQISRRHREAAPMNSLLDNLFQRFEGGRAEQLDEPTLVFVAPPETLEIVTQIMCLRESGFGDPLGEALHDMDIAETAESSRTEPELSVALLKGVDDSTTGVVSPPMQEPVRRHATCGRRPELVEAFTELDRKLSTYERRCFLDEDMPGGSRVRRG